MQALMDAFSHTTMQALVDAFSMQALSHTTMQALSMQALSHTTAIAGICCAVVVLVVYRRADDGGIPWATGAVPVLGHALAYQQGPADFVAAQCRAVGPVFRVNLAGKRMVVVGASRAAARRVALVLPTSVCAGEVARAVAARLDAEGSRHVDGFASLPHTEGCGAGHAGDGGMLYERLIFGHLRHPRVAAAALLD